MVFFKNKGSAGDGQVPDAITSIIGKNMQLVGDISFKGRLRLDGMAEGNIKGEYLILGEEGMVTGDVACDVFVCSGKVEGNVNVKKLHVIKGGVISGKVETLDLTVESGAFLNGEVKSKTQELRLVPGSSIPQEEWENKIQEVAGKKVHQKKG
jgi:cytoskeletal protein CcmA (bactofilin family)